MSGGMPQFDSQATLTVSEGYDLKNQHHYTSRRCGCDYFHTRWSFRVWQVLLFLLGVAVIIAIMGLVIAMFGPGNTNLRYSKKEAIVAPTVEGDGGRLNHILQMLCLALKPIALLLFAYCQREKRV